MSRPEVPNTLRNARSVIQNLSRSYPLLAFERDAASVVVAKIDAILNPKASPLNLDLDLDDEAPLPTDARARTDDPDTSQEAAASITPEKLRESQLRVLRVFLCFGSAGGIDEDVLDFFATVGVRVTRSGTQTRRCELQRAGLVEYTGEKRRKKTGRRARVHRITEKGREFLFVRGAMDTAKPRR